MGSSLKSPERASFVLAVHGSSPTFREELRYLARVPGGRLADTQGDGSLHVRAGGARLSWDDLGYTSIPTVLVLLQDDEQAEKLYEQLARVNGKLVVPPGLALTWGDRAALICEPREWTARIPLLFQIAVDAESRRLIEERLPEICDLLQQATGHDFRHYRQAFVARRVERRMGFTHLLNLDDYLELIRSHHEELQLLFQDLLVGVTQFFRDPDSWEALGGPLLEMLRSGGGLRIWSAGCATGEEAYSVAMLVLELLEAHDLKADVKVLATDIDEEALAVARSGTYGIHLKNHLSPERLSRFFTSTGEGYRISREVRQICQFSQHNLVTDPPFVEIDLVLCRNVLIYLSPALQQKLVPLFHYALRGGGYLLLGSSETLGDSSALYQLASEQARLYRRLEAATSVSLGSPDLFLRSMLRNSNRDVDLTQLVGGILADEFTPRALVVNREGAILWSSGRLEHLFRLGEGNFQNQVVQLARKGLRNLLRSALLQATREQRTILQSGIRIEANEEGPACLLDLTVQPMPEMGSHTGLYLLVLQDRPVTLAPAHEDSGGDGRLFEVERELARVTDELDRVVQELESANEELKSSNEELWAMNEELRVTNEELEKSRADVELKNKQLSRANLDLSHLLTATNIPTVFLDFDQRVLRYTPSSRRFYPFQDSDLGRPIHEIRDLALNMPPIPAHPEQDQEVEVEMPDGSSFVRKVLPYRDYSGQELGTVVTFADVTELRRSRARLDDSLKELEAVYEYAPIALAVVDSEMQVTKSNRLFEQMGITRLPFELREAIKRAWETAVPVHDVEFSQKSRYYRAGLYPQSQTANLVVRDVTESKQREQEALRKDSLLQASGEFLAIADPEGPLLYLNEAGQKLCGVSGFRLPGLEQCFFAEEQERLRVEVLPALESGSGWSGSWRLRHRISGQAVPVRVSFSLLDSGLIHVVARDRRPEQQLEELLAQEREAAQGMLDQMPVGILFIDANYRYLAANTEACRILERSPEDLLSRTILELTPEFQGSPFQEAFDRALRGEPQVLSRYWEPHGRYYNVRYLPHPSGVMSIFEDITEAKRTEAVAQEMILAVSGSSDFIATLDSSLKIRFVNQAGLRLLGREQAVGLELNQLYPEWARADVRTGLAHLQHDTHFTVETALLRQNGEELPVSQVFQRVFDDEGRALGYCTIARDITELRRREAYLRESEGRFRRAISQAPIPVLIFTEDGEVLSVSDSLVEMTGYELSEVARLQHWVLIAHREKADWVREQLVGWFQKERQQSFEANVYTRRGDALFWRFTGSPVGILEDGRRYLVMMAVDLSERLEKERALQEGSNFLRRTLDSLQLFAGVCTPDGILVEVNRTALELAHLQPEQVLGKPLAQTYWWSHDATLRHELRTALETAATGESVRFDTQVLVSDGQTMALDFQVVPMRDAAGRITHLVPSGLDITQRLATERARQADQDRFRALLNSTAEAIYGLDLQGRFTFANHSCLEMLGYDSDTELLGCDAHQKIHYLHLDGSPYPASECPIQRALRNSQPVYAPKEYLIRKDGSFMPVEMWAHPKRIAGRITGCVVTYFDISERLRIAEELSQAKAAAESASQAKSDFLANMSHEIRTPMAAILGYVDILLRQVSEPDDVECLRVIQRNGVHLLEIINDILDLSKIEAGRLQLETVPLSLEVVLGEVMSLMNVRAVEKNLQLSLDFEGAVPRTITSDPTRLRQVLMNLLGNAIKFTEEGSVALRVRMRDQHLLEISVRDTGIGISEEQLDQLFQPFTQADTSVTRRFGGTGLGLVISRKLIEMLGGTIEVSSQPGRGSIFRFTLATGDLAGVESVQEGPMELRSSASEAISGNLPDLSGLRVLVVDDRRDIRYLVQSYLEEAGAAVETGGDGQAALDYLEHTAPDILVLDMQMPRLDGYSTARELRQRGCKIPILALTASAMKYDRELCLQAGCDSYLSKPVQRAALLRQVEVLVRRGQALRVLVVEDNPMAGVALRATLQSLGCEATLVADGEGALEKAAAEAPDFAFIDLGLPGMDGWELLRLLRQQNPGCRCVLHSGRAADEVVSPQPGLAFDEIVQKPASRDQLNAILFP
ncbi:MAG: PAS domain S-box protein [Candidatus Eremiobacteraeota bacterium]|nr:PAS domain S-box protein [Candidatus Eremiobacteraeota bacterium]